MSVISKVGIGLGSVAVLAVGALIAALMIFSAPSAGTQEPVVTPVSVEVIQVHPEPAARVVQATGAVEPERQVGLTPEVSGRVVWLDPRLRPGGRFAEGDTLLRLDPRDVQAALEAERARLAQAELELALESERQRTAEREWAMVGESGDPQPLALRRPHLAVATANVRSAQAAVDRAELNVARTRLRAPFNSIVITQNVEVGQVVGTQGTAVTLVGTDAVRVVASVPVAQLSAFQVPGLQGQEGAVARVRSTRGQSVEREGRVSGVVGQLDPQTRTAQVVVQVSDPLSGASPLLPGSYVTVEIVGLPLDDVVRLPREALVDDTAVWLDRDGALARRDVDVGWRTDDSVYVIDGLSEGDRVVVSTLSLPIVGQPLDARVRVAAHQER